MYHLGYEVIKKIMLKKKGGSPIAGETALLAKLTDLAGYGNIVC
jgi:hypothetical protein